MALLQKIPIAIQLHVVRYRTAAHALFVVSSWRPLRKAYQMLSRRRLLPFRHLIHLEGQLRLAFGSAATTSTQLCRLVLRKSLGSCMYTKPERARTFQAGTHLQTHLLARTARIMPGLHFGRCVWPSKRHWYQQTTPKSAEVQSVWINDNGARYQEEPSRLKSMRFPRTGSMAADLWSVRFVLGVTYQNLSPLGPCSRGFFIAVDARLISHGLPLWTTPYRPFSRVEIGDLLAGRQISCCKCFLVPVAVQRRQAMYCTFGAGVRSN